MEGDEEGIGETSGFHKSGKSGGGRIWQRRQTQSSSKNPWNRISIPLAPSRRRDRGVEPGQASLGARSSPGGRRMSLGGNVIAVREELTPSPARMSTPSAGQHGIHGIRYHQSYSDGSLEDVQQEILNDPGGNQAETLLASASASASSTSVSGAPLRRPGDQSQDTIAEEESATVDGGKSRENGSGNKNDQNMEHNEDQGHCTENRGQVHDFESDSVQLGREMDGDQGNLTENGREGGDVPNVGCEGNEANEGDSKGTVDGVEGRQGELAKARERTASDQGGEGGQVYLTPLDVLVDSSTIRDAVGLQRSISPASGPSDLRPLGIVSPRTEHASRQRVNSWATLSSPPVLSGPFSRSRSKSRSPRRRLSIGGTSIDGLPRLPIEIGGRLSADFGRPLMLQKEPSICSATEEISVWNDGDIGIAAASQTLGPLPGEEEGEEEDEEDEEEEGREADRELQEEGDSKNRGGGPFTESSLEMARLRLPNMELGFEDEGFFGIDPRRLIIGREIARGAFGVVHEAVLLDHPAEDEGWTGEKSGMAAANTSLGGEERDHRPGYGQEQEQEQEQEQGAHSGAAGGERSAAEGDVTTEEDVNASAAAVPSGEANPGDRLLRVDAAPGATMYTEYEVTDNFKGGANADGGKEPHDIVAPAPAENSADREGAGEQGNEGAGGAHGDTAEVRRVTNISSVPSAVNVADSASSTDTGCGARVEDEDGALVASVTAQDDSRVGDNDKHSRASVAVKIQQVPLDEEEQANLLGELAMLRNHAHPHLVEYIGTALAMERGVDTVMIAMEWCTNGALREALKLNISWPLKVRIARDMTDGLHFLHEHGIIHRDIKTPNVLIDNVWRAKLCDYNFAIDQTSAIKQAFCAGTAEFMSPEVLLSEDYGLPSDIFSLGMIFVEMLTGKEPSATFPERLPQNFFVVSEDEIQGELLEGCPSSFSLLQTQCLFAEPSERPTAEDAYGWLQELLNEMGPEEITLPQRGPPLPVLTEGAAIAREGNVINASPKGTEHHWIDTEAMELQINSMVENAVERVLTDRAVALQVQSEEPASRGSDEGAEARLDEMREEIESLRTACEERDSRISALEVQALRNTATLKMLSSALEVAYKMLEGQQAARLQSNSFHVGTDEALHDRVSGGRDSIEHHGEDVRL